MSKPREFWIELWFEKLGSKMVENTPVATHAFKPCTDQDEVVHVIEYSAVTELQEQVRVLESIVRSLVHYGPGLIHKEYEVGSAAVTNLINEATEALKRVEEMRGEK